MDISIGQDLEDFVEEVVSDGRYASASAVVREGLRLVEERERKLQALRETIDASLAKGGAYSDEEVGEFLEQARKKREAIRAFSR